MYIGEGIGVYFGMILPGKSVPGVWLERVESECRDGIDRKDEKGCDDGRVGNFCGKYCWNYCAICIGT